MRLPDNLKVSEISILFPHQLFESNPALKRGRPVFMLEEYLFFRQYKFHKQKLVFHRASMKAYKSFLEQRGYDITYIEANDLRSDIRKFVPYLQTQGVTEIHYTDVTDCWLQQRLTMHARRLNISLVTYESPLFLSTTDDIDTYFRNKKRFYQADFYMQQRMRFQILIDENQQPAGGRWSFDTENRLKYPKGKIPPAIHYPDVTEYWKEAVAYVEANFATNYGRTGIDFVYPTTFEESRTWLTHFFQSRFAEFGNYEDALVAREHILHHSVLTPMMNVGLLTPKEVLNRALTFAHENDIPLNSLEGIVRQILGWREFIRGVYEVQGVKERTTNHWKFKRKIPPSFWHGTTGIAPVDNTIKKILDTGYCHHIGRLMVLGNFMLLCEFDPDEVYTWFMELFIDAYDWVMVPNVYGMSQFADGGRMATKPYISGSNYLMKMSDYKKGEWQQVWDGLFWRFMHTHRDFFLQNPRLNMLVKSFDKMPEDKRQEHLRQANEYLARLDGVRF